jgi:hypothetical protein
MEYYRVEADAIQEAQTEGQFIYLIQHSSSNLDDGELGRLRRVRGGGKYAEVSLDLSLGSNGV